LIILPLRYPP